MNETERRPDLIINDNNLFDTMTALAGGTSSLGTVWNNWQTNWSGQWSESAGAQAGNVSASATVSGTVTSRTRTGISREITGSNVQRTSFGDKVVDIAFTIYQITNYFIYSNKIKT